MEKEIHEISRAAGKVLGAFVRSLKQFEADTRQSRKDLFQELLRKGGGCCGERNRGRQSGKNTAKAGS